MADLKTQKNNFVLSFYFSRYGVKILVVTGFLFLFLYPCGVLLFENSQASYYNSSGSKFYGYYLSNAGMNNTVWLPPYQGFKNLNLFFRFAYSLHLALVFIFGGTWSSFRSNFYQKINGINNWSSFLFLGLLTFCAVLTLLVISLSLFCGKRHQKIRIMGLSFYTFAIIITTFFIVGYYLICNTSKFWVQHQPDLFNEPAFTFLSIPLLVGFALAGGGLLASWFETFNKSSRHTPDRKFNLTNLSVQPQNQSLPIKHQQELLSERIKAIKENLQSEQQVLQHHHLETTLKRSQFIRHQSQFTPKGTVQTGRPIVSPSQSTHNVFKHMRSHYDQKYKMPGRFVRTLSVAEWNREQRHHHHQVQKQHRERSSFQNEWNKK